MTLLANFLSGLSLVSGFLSLVFCLKASFIYASWAIILSVILDGLDGQIARRSSLVHEFGKEFDSLVDVVAFGIAPSILIYTFVYPAFSYTRIAALCIYVLCSVVRLARYNITTKEKVAHYFYGLPTTVGGGLIASLVLLYKRQAVNLTPGHLLILLLVLAYLLVSKIKYPNLDGLKKVFSRKKSLFFLILFVILMVTIGFYLRTHTFSPELVVFMLFTIYLLFSPFMLKFFATAS